jgi:hypothetical protein
MWQARSRQHKRYFGTGGVAVVNGSSSNWTAIASVPQPAALP